MKKVEETIIPKETVPEPEKPKQLSKSELRDSVLRELVETERNYVRDLGILQVFLFFFEKKKLAHSIN